MNNAIDDLVELMEAFGFTEFEVPINRRRGDFIAAFGLALAKADLTSPGTHPVTRFFELWLDAYYPKRIGQ